MNRQQRRAVASIARKHQPQVEKQMDIAQLKGQIVALEAEQAKAQQTFHETAGALKLARHQLARMEYAKHIADEAAKAKADESKDAPTLASV